MWRSQLGELGAPQRGLNVQAHQFRIAEVRPRFHPVLGDLQPPVEESGHDQPRSREIEPRLLGSDQACQAASASFLDPRKVRET